MLAGPGEQASDLLQRLHSAIGRRSGGEEFPRGAAIADGIEILQGPEDVPSACVGFCLRSGCPSNQLIVDWPDSRADAAS